MEANAYMYFVLLVLNVPVYPTSLRKTNLLTKYGKLRIINSNYLEAGGSMSKLINLMIFSFYHFYLSKLIRKDSFFCDCRYLNSLI